MPLPIGALISGALQVGGSIYGGIKAAKANKQIADNLAKRQRENQSWFDRRYNEDATQRADAQRLMELTRKRIAERNQQAAGRAAVMGGDDAGLAATKQANNDAIADTASRIAASADTRKDTIEQTYIGTKNAISDQQNAMEAAKAQEQSLALSLGDSVWFINSRYLRDSLNGPYNKIFEEYVPLYFNEKIAFVQFLVTEISYLPYEIDTFEGLTAGVGRGSMFNVGDYGYVDVPHFVLDLDNKEVFLVDRNYLMFLLERYPDMKHRYEMMQDQNEFYMINQFFWDYVERLSQDPYAPVLGVIGE